MKVLFTVMFLDPKINQYQNWAIKHLTKLLEKLKKGKINIVLAKIGSAWSYFKHLGAGVLFNRYWQNIGQRQSFVFFLIVMYCGN